MGIQAIPSSSLPLPKQSPLLGVADLSSRHQYLTSQHHIFPHSPYNTHLVEDTHGWRAPAEPREWIYYGTSGPCVSSKHSIKKDHLREQKSLPLAATGQNLW